MLPQWVGHGLVPKPDGKLNKPPYSPRGGMASSTDPATWGTYDQALALVDSGKAKVPGFAFTEACGLTGVDFDNCRDPETGDIEPWVMAQVRAFDTYAEVSPSGRGVKLIGRGQASHNGKNGTKGRHPGQVEMYSRDRFFTVTGNVLQGYETIRDCQQQLEDLHLLEWPRETQHVAAAPMTSLSLADDDILQKIGRASNAPAFMSLYAGDTDAYGGDHSAADFALVNYLAFYTQDADQLGRIVASSGLNRPKWDRADYRASTINKVLATIRETYSPSRTQAPPPAPVAPVDPSREIAALRARIACLEDIVDTQRAALVDRDERIQAYESDIGGYTDVLIEVAKLVDERITRGMVESDGSVHVPYGLVAARRTGKGASPDIRNAVKSRVSKAVSKAVERGLLTKHTVTQLSSVDGDTGEVFDAPRRTRMTYIQWGPDYRTMRVSLAKCKRPENAPKRGGDQVRCEDHPEAKVLTTRIDRCSVCRKILRATGPSGVAPQPPPEPRIESDKANLLYIPIQRVAEVDKANLLLQDSGAPPPAEPSVETTTPIMEVDPTPWDLLYDRAQSATPIICSSTTGGCSQQEFCAKQGTCRWGPHAPASSTSLKQRKEAT